VDEQTPVEGNAALEGEQDAATEALGDAGENQGDGDDGYRGSLVIN
jgi:hypothetical protein